MTSDKAQITDKLVKGLTPPAPGKDGKPRNEITYDGTAPDAIRGFGIRITSAGAKSFVLNYRLNGGEFRHTIGAYSTWSVQAAREEAKRLRRLIDTGINPAAERREKREADTVKELAQRYIDEYLPKKAASSQAKNKAMLENDILPAIGRMKVADVTLDDMERLHRSITKRAPIRANRVLATASKMFSLAVRWRMRTDNPCKGIERNPENKRARYLSPQEIAKLGDALASYPSQNAANCVRFCLLTGCRSGEAMGAKWEQFNLQKGIWTKPTLETKQRREHTVPLSAPAMALLNQLRAKADADSVYVFPGRKKGEPLKQIRSCWESVTKAAAIGRVVKDEATGEQRWQHDVRVHDLRHSFASIAASGGASLPLIGALLGHTQARTTQRYSHLFDDALRTVADRVGEFVEAAGKPSAQLVPLKGGAA